MINIGRLERVVRVLIGMGFFVFYLLMRGNIRYFGLIGFFPILTGLVGTCPTYSILGINTNREKKSF